MWFITLSEENEKKRLARSPEGGEPESLAEGGEAGEGTSAQMWKRSRETETVQEAAEASGLQDI